jgi:hypothetical protein
MQQAHVSQVVQELAQANSKVAEDLARCTQQVDESSYCCGMLSHYLAMHQRFLTALFGQEPTAEWPAEAPAADEAKAQTSKELQAILEYCQDQQWTLAQTYKKLLDSEMKPEVRRLVEQQFRELQRAIAGFEYNFSLFRSTH